MKGGVKRNISPSMGRREPELSWQPAPGLDLTVSSRFTRFVITSVVKETAFESDKATFVSDEVTFESNETTFESSETTVTSNVTTFKSNVTTFDPEEASFIPFDVIDKSRTSRGVARDEVKFVSNVVKFDLNVVTFDAKEVPSGSRAFIHTMNTTLSEAVTATSASDAAFFTTQHVTSVAEEIIGDAPVMFLSTRNRCETGVNHQRCMCLRLGNSFPHARCIGFGPTLQILRKAILPDRLAPRRFEVEWG